jgi:GNAT superfamily N-acetyltransferase
MPSVLRIRHMTTADLPFGVHLSRQAGWNQTEADWRRLLDLEPEGCFLAELDGSPAGTTATCVFGPVAWVALVLVEEAVRGRGVGTALVARALAYLEDRGIAQVRLDATPLGRPVYERLGFAAEYEIARLGGTLPPTDPVVGVLPVTRERLGELADFDRAVTGAERSRLLTQLLQEHPHALRMVARAGVVEGYLAARPGAHAVQVGPCVATAAAGSLLLRDAGHRFAGRAVFFDVPVPNAVAQAMARGLGLTVQRRLLRMGRGPRVAERANELWLSSGPEKG